MVRHTYMFCSAPAVHLIKREAEHLRTRIEELDFERPVVHFTTLTHQLIQARTRYRARAVARDVVAVRGSGWRSVDRDPESYGLAIRGWCEHQMEIARVEAIGNAAVRPGEILRRENRAQILARITPAVTSA